MELTQHEAAIGRGGRLLTRLVYADPGRMRAAVQAAVVEAREKGIPLVAVTRRLTRELKAAGLPWTGAETMAQTLVHIALSELPPHPDPRRT